MAVQHEIQTDLVITWVDGDDPRHRAKRYAYMSEGSENLFDDVAGETRFRQKGEIFFCVASVLRFAPFIKRIYLVTDGQDPHLDAFLAKHFPDRCVSVEIVDHRVLFRGYEQYLPTFNSLSIETMLWRIPGLSEHFLYMNDDLLFLSDVKRSDFFDDSGRPICYVSRYPTLLAVGLRALKPKKKGHKTFGYKDSMLNAEKILGYRAFFWKIAHTPFALRKSFFETFYAAHPAAMESNIRHKFRHPSQHNPQSLFYGALLRNGDAVSVNPDDKLLYIKPRGRNYIQQKISAAEKQDRKFCCIQSLDTASETDCKILYTWLSLRIGLDGPYLP